MLAPYAPAMTLARRDEDEEDEFQLADHLLLAECGLVSGVFGLADHEFNLADGLDACAAASAGDEIGLFE